VTPCLTAFVSAFLYWTSSYLKEYSVVYHFWFRQALVYLQKAVTQGGHRL
jgi:hypothetical protein